jgi:hypothetical protein
MDVLLRNQARGRTVANAPNLGAATRPENLADDWKMTWSGIAPRDQKRAAESSDADLHRTSVDADLRGSSSAPDLHRTSVDADLRGSRFDADMGASSSRRWTSSGRKKAGSHHPPAW